MQGNKKIDKMANLKSLVKDTVIYGMSSILGRFLNYLLVPLYTIKMVLLQTFMPTQLCSWLS